MNSDQGVFLRQASGLRRSASAFDVFIFNTGLISVGLAVAFNAYYLPGFYPGARVEISSAIATALMLMAGAGFYYWAVLLPRSGGNYVFVSRALHPAVGFLVSWIEVWVLLFYTAVAAALIVRIGACTLLGGLGVLLEWPALTRLGEQVGATVPTFLLGGLVIIVSSLLLCKGMRSFFAVQKVMFSLAILGTVALFVGVLRIQPEAIGSQLANLFPGYDSHRAVTAAVAQGWTTAESTLRASLSAIGWPLLPLAGGVLSIGIGAEIQRARRSQLVGILGSIAFSGSLFAIIGARAEAALGRDLLGAIAYNSSQGATTAVPGGIPWLHFLVAVLSGNVALCLLIGLGVIAWIYLWIPGMLAYCNRSFLAWSLDRIGPAWLGDVSPTRQTPIHSSLLGGLTAVLLLGAYLWVPALQGLVIFQVLMFAWAISLLAGALFPFLRQRLYRTAVAGSAVIRSRIPLATAMTLGGASLAIAGLVLWNDPVAAGHSPLAMASLLSITVSGLTVYLLAFLIRKRQGVELWRVFREIPIE